ncbi:hemolysin, partial [Stenotrophomonas indicatrix]|nr:hemolysin [Stenotrophomonas indicatrix]
MNARENATLSNHVYKDPLPPPDSDIAIDGTKYTVLARRDSGNGYQGVVYLNIETKEVIAAHRGTEFDRQALLDGGVDAAMVTAR